MPGLYELIKVIILVIDFQTLMSARLAAVCVLMASVRTSWAVTSVLVRRGIIKMLNKQLV